MYKRQTQDNSFDDEVEKQTDSQENGGISVLKEADKGEASLSQEEQWLEQVKEEANRCV